MSWLDDGEAPEGSGALAWWKESFVIAVHDLFKIVDDCVGMDIQMHNMAWFVQEAQTARIAVQMLDERQDWYHDFIVEQSLKQQDDEADYWGADEEDEEEEVQDSEAKKTYDEMFHMLRTALYNVKHLSNDTEDWKKLGPVRRLGKNVWHNWRFFYRSICLHKAVVRIMDIADLDVLAAHYQKEPNFGVARKIRHPAVRHFWYENIAPRVLGSHTSLSKRTPPVLHPNHVQANLKCVDAVTQAPMALLKEQISRYFKLNEREKMVLPYLLGSGCCDHEFGGHFTMGVNPVCTAEDLEKAKQVWERQAELVLIGPGGGGWPESEKGQQQKHEAEQQAAALEQAYLDARTQAAEMIDCKCLQVMMDYWCPQPEAQRHSQAQEILPSMYTETRWAHLEMRKLAFELPMRSKGLYPPPPKMLGVRKLGGKKVFRAGAFALIAALRLWRMQSWGLKAFLDNKVEECLEAAEKSKHAVMMAEERLQREKAKPQRQLAEIKYWQGYIKEAEESIAAGQLAREAYLDRLKHDVPRLVGGSLPRHPLKKALEAAAKSLIWVDPEKDEAVRQPDRLVTWFHFECSNDYCRSLVDVGGGGGGRFLVRYSKEPGILVCNWSEGSGRELKSARIFRVLHPVKKNVTRSDVKTTSGEGGGGLAGGKGGGTQGGQAEIGGAKARQPLGRKGALTSAQVRMLANTLFLAFDACYKRFIAQLAQERKRAAKKEKMEAGSSTADPLGFDPTASTHELAGAGDDSKQENQASGGDGPEGLMQQGFAWQPNARVMETYDSLGELVWAARGMLRNPAVNTMFQLNKRAGYLD